jgi:3-isopropylmalate/(R)-2-methylmalate dehydratase small subunit
MQKGMRVKMKKFETLQSSIVVIDIENIDTDQIIGSDHLKITNKSGLGKHLFSDWRYLKDGSVNPDFVLNQAEANRSKVLVAGENFGCGSSREHAPWALLDFGIKVVISSSIADIFSNNSIKNGLLPIQVSQEQHQYLLSKNSGDIEVDLENLLIRCADNGNEKVFEFKLENFARYCLLNGIEQLDFLMSHSSDIERFEQSEQQRLKSTC